VHSAAAGLIQAGQDAQEGGLANAVGSYDGNAGTLWDGKGEPSEDIIRAKSLAQVGSSEEWHAMSISGDNGYSL
jgi:hypothetical protein